MDSRKLDLAETITLEEGKVLADSEAEVKRSMNIIQFSAGEGRRLLGNINQSEIKNNVAYTMRKPLGVVGIITPWNFPLAIPAWKIAPALICGNTVIFKPAISTPLSAIILVEIFEEAGFEWRKPGCSMCLAMNPDKLVGDEVCASSSNRNFMGRQGSATGRTILMSPIMVAASAISGSIADAREIFELGKKI